MQAQRFSLDFKNWIFVCSVTCVNVLLPILLTSLKRLWLKGCGYLSFHTPSQVCLPGKKGHLNPKSNWASFGREGGRSFWSSLWSRQPKLQWPRGTESGQMGKPGKKYCYGANCGEVVQGDVVQTLTSKVPSPPAIPLPLTYLHVFQAATSGRVLTATCCAIRGMLCPESVFPSILAQVSFWCFGFLE